MDGPTYSIIVGPDSKHNIIIQSQKRNRRFAVAVLFLFPWGNPCSLCWRHHSISAVGGDAEGVLCSPQCAITRGLRAQGIEMSQNDGVLSRPTVRYLLAKANREICMYLIHFHPFEDHATRSRSVSINCIGMYKHKHTYANSYSNLEFSWAPPKSRHFHRS